MNVRSPATKYPDQNCAVVSAMQWTIFLHWHLPCLPTLVGFHPWI